MELDPLTLHRTGVDLCLQAVGGIGPDQWRWPTPCAGWDVRALVNHLTAEDLWVPELLAGRTPEEVGDRFDGDVLGDDPVGTHARAAEAAHAAFATPGALERTVTLSFGQVPGSVYCLQRATDLVVHAWDLCRATGQPFTVAEEVAAYLLEWNRPHITEEVRAAGIFGPEVPVPEDAPAMDRLLGLLGRHP